MTKPPNKFPPLQAPDAPSMAAGGAVARAEAAAPATLWKSRWLSVVLLAADGIGFAGCWLAAYGFRAALTPVLGPINDIAPYLKVFPLVVAVALLNVGAWGLYAHRRRFTSLNRPSTVMRAGYHWLLYIVVIGFFFKELDLGRSVILLAAILGLIYLYTSRTVLKGLKARALRAGIGTVRSAIVGGGRLALDVKEALSTHPEVGFRLMGLIIHRGDEPDGATRQRLEAMEVPVLGTTEEIAALVEQHGIEEIFLAMGDLQPEEQFRLLEAADVRGVSVHAVSDIFGVLNDQAKTEEISSTPVITLRNTRMPLHQAALKRALDLACSLGGVLVWLVFFHWWIALKIRRESPGPVFFKQDRVGQGGRVFTIYKYRTMRTETDPYAVAPTADTDPRITNFGRWLRKTSLDELPQLLNVLRGEMSMVGPRPEMPFIVAQYQPWERRRLDVKPGLTGLWQVVGRKNLPLHLNMQYDFYYIKNQGFLMDLEILVRTIPAVLKGKGAF